MFVKEGNVDVTSPIEMEENNKGDEDGPYGCQAVTDRSHSSWVSWEESWLFFVSPQYCPRTANQSTLPSWIPMFMLLVMMQHVLPISVWPNILMARAGLAPCSPKRPVSGIAVMASGWMYTTIVPGLLQLRSNEAKNG